MNWKFGIFYVIVSIVVAFTTGNFMFPFFFYIVVLVAESAYNAIFHPARNCPKE